MGGKVVFALSSFLSNHAAAQAEFCSQGAGDILLSLLESTQSLLGRPAAARAALKVQVKLLGLVQDLGTSAELAQGKREAAGAVEVLVVPQTTESQEGRTTEAEASTEDRGKEGAEESIEGKVEGSVEGSAKQDGSNADQVLHTNTAFALKLCNSAFALPCFCAAFALQDWCF